MKSVSTFAEQRFHGELDFPISIYHNSFSREENILAPIHHHPEFEFLIAVEGCVEVQIEDRHYMLSPGDGVFINSSLLHAIFCYQEQASAFVAIVFSAELLTTRTSRIYQTYLCPIIEHSLLLPEPLDRSICNTLLRLADAYKEKAECYEFFIHSTLLSIFGTLCTHPLERKNTPQNPRFESIKNALSYIEANYMEEITLAQLADVSGLSREHFCRIFSDLADMTPITYINRYRIQKSMELLKNTDKSISDISGLCGFGSCSYFNKIFRRLEGQTPKQWRLSHQSAN